MANEDNLRKFYDAVCDDYSDIGTYEEFRSKMANPYSRTLFYKAVRDDFEDIGNWDEFNAKVGYPTPDWENLGESLKSDKAQATPAQPAANKGASKPADKKATRLPGVNSFKTAYAFGGPSDEILILRFNIFGILHIIL